MKKLLLPMLRLVGPKLCCAGLGFLLGPGDRSRDIYRDGYRDGCRNGCRNGYRVGTETGYRDRYTDADRDG